MESKQPFRFGSTFLVPQLLILAISFVALFAVFATMIARQDADSATRERTLAERGLAEQVAFVKKNLRDYTRWTDAVDNLAVTTNTDWANDNIGPYLANVQGYDSTIVTDVDGRTFYASEGIHQSNRSAADMLGSELTPLLKTLRATPDGEESRIVDVIPVGGRPTIVAASQILPSIGETYGRTIPRRYLFVTQTIDQELITQIAQSYGLQSASLVAKAADQDSALPIKTGDGRNLAAMVWSVERPGATTLKVILPWLIMITVIACLLSIMMLRSAHRATARLASNEARARHMAHHDMLTGLPNRRSMLSKGTQTSTTDPMAVLFIDLDGFKDVNDLFGHQAGDVLLREATDRLRRIIADRGLLARLGGDEFAVLLTSADAVDQAEAIGESIVTALSQPFLANGINIVVSGSIGLASRTAEESVEDLARFADIAMYAAKRDGKSRVRVYGPAMSEGRELRKRLESELREALDKGDIEVAFQPIVRASDAQVVCYEALARWTSPTQGPVGPAIFVPIAEESGLIVAMGEAVLRQACTAARDWDIDIAVNLSPAQFWHEGLAADILRILDETGFPPHRLELEITEGYLINRPEMASKTIAELQASGIRIALDDFGTGFASIGYLRRFNLDTIKMDRSLTEHIVTDPDAAEVAQAVIALGRSLKLPITAEGIEVADQADLLRIAGCQRFQGWHYGYPTPASEIALDVSVGRSAA